MLAGDTRLYRPFIAISLRFEPCASISRISHWPFGSQSEWAESHQFNHYQQSNKHLIFDQPSHFDKPPRSDQPSQLKQL
ncbi:hypothetical protein BKA66DRAFT_460841 [Pyrenochaeta sp. MPI-SDFR-AT-0127]|nr:hypothetical protein BKA66DRAFT_460841 [Pyrenochaeta sp. MPI-SDFR-AT-0127]